MSEDAHESFALGFPVCDCCKNVYCRCHYKLCKCGKCVYCCRCSKFEPKQKNDISPVKVDIKTGDGLTEKDAELMRGMKIKW